MKITVTADMKIRDLEQEIKQLKEQVARELKDNNGLREYNTKYFQQIREISELPKSDLHWYKVRTILDGQT